MFLKALALVCGQLKLVFVNSVIYSILAIAALTKVCEQKTYSSN